MTIIIIVRRSKVITTRLISMDMKTVPITKQVSMGTTMGLTGL